LISSVLPEAPMAVERIAVPVPSPSEQGDLRSGPDRQYEIVLLAASAGGLAAISVVLGGLPQDFPVPIVIVQHLDPRHASLMAEILRRRTSLDVEEAQAGTRVESSTVYIAPPNEHLLVSPDGRLTLSHADPVHFVRPSADLLFESGAESFPGRVIGVVLTGTGSDSNMGVRAIRSAGGAVIAQDPTSAEFAGMPQAAIDTGGVDLVLPLEEIGPTLVELVEQHGDPS
jgi:two-component system, chemotaxis family, protein-glutamate methylesterase/glutaminase